MKSKAVLYIRTGGKLPVWLTQRWHWPEEESNGNTRQNMTFTGNLEQKG